MTLLYHDPCFLEHDTGRHPENATRLRAIGRHLESSGLASRCKTTPVLPVSMERLARLHAPSYVQEVKEFARNGGGRIESDTIVSPASFEVALRAAGAVCDAVGRLLAGEDSQALCLVRPPGHHALPAGAMGFCLFNNIALGARTAVAEFGLDRVLVVDWDVHHGNGTQDAFWEDEQVGFFSIHRFPFYPGSGDWDETGTGPALGTKLNVPVPFGTPRNDYLAQFRTALEEISARIKPQLVLISAGFDAHRADPIGSLGLEVEDFAELTKMVGETADMYCGGKLVSVLEGGYNPEDLAQCVGIHLEVLLERESRRDGDRIDPRQTGGPHRS